MIDTKEWRKSMAWLQIDNKIETSARDIYLLLDEIDRFRAEVKAARMDGFKLAQSLAYEECVSYHEAYTQMCAQEIEAMQPPAEWSED